MVFHLSEMENPVKHFLWNFALLFTAAYPELSLKEGFQTIPLLKRNLNMVVARIRGFCTWFC